MDEVWYIFVRFGITSQLFGFPLATPFRVYGRFLFQCISFSAVCLPTIFFFLFFSFRQKWYVVKLAFVVTAAAMH